VGFVRKDERAAGAHYEWFGGLHDRIHSTALRLDRPNEMRVGRALPRSAKRWEATAAIVKL
jgi:hypothetical protein